MVYKPSLDKMVLNQCRHTMICYFWIGYVHFDGHAPTLKEIVVYRQVMLNCQMSIVQFTNFVLIAKKETG